MTVHSARLNGILTNDGGEACTTSFRYGTSPTLATYTILPEGSGKNTGAALSAVATGLARLTTYYFQAEAVNSVGNALGAILSFKTKAELPSVLTGPAFKQGNFSQFALLASLTADGGEPCNVGIQWVQDDPSFYASGFNPVFTNTKMVNTGVAPMTVTANLSGLALNRKYYYRAIAINSFSTSYGVVGAFYTFDTAGGGVIPGLLPDPPPPPIRIHINPNPGTGITQVSTSPVPWTPGSNIVVVVEVDHSGPGITEVVIVPPGPGIIPITPPITPPIPPDPIKIYVDPNPGVGDTQVSMSTEPWTPGSDVIPVIEVNAPGPDVMTVIIVDPGPGIPPIIPTLPKPVPIDFGQLSLSFLKIGLVVGAGSAMTALFVAQKKKKKKLEEGK